MRKMVARHFPPDGEFNDALTTLLQETVVDACELLSTEERDCGVLVFTFDNDGDNRVCGAYAHLNVWQRVRMMKELATIMAGLISYDGDDAGISLFDTGEEE